MGPAQGTLSARGVLWVVALLAAVVGFDRGMRVVRVQAELLCGRAGCTPAGLLSGSRPVPGYRPLHPDTLCCSCPQGHGLVLELI